MDISNCENAIKEIEKSIKILENSKFEETRRLIINGENVKLGLNKPELKRLFSILDNKKTIREIIKNSSFSENIKIIQINGGFIIKK